jgi:hypothetical protein
MRTHVRDCCGLARCSGGSGRCRGAHLTCGGSAGEPAADLFCDVVELVAGEGPRSRDGIAGAGIAWSFRLEQAEHSLRAISSPHSNDSPFGFAERLRRTHNQILPGVSDLSAPTSFQSMAGIHAGMRRVLLARRAGPFADGDRGNGSDARWPSSRMMLSPLGSADTVPAAATDRD